MLSHICFVGRCCPAALEAQGSSYFIPATRFFTRLSASWVWARPSLSPKCNPPYLWAASGVPATMGRGELARSGTSAPTSGSDTRGLVPAHGGSTQHFVPASGSSAGDTGLAALAENIRQPLARLQAEASATRPDHVHIGGMLTCDSTWVAVCALVHADPRARALAMAWLKRPYRAVSHELDEAARYLLWWTNAITPSLAVLPFEQHPSPPLLGTLALRILCTDSKLLVQSMLCTNVLQGRQLQQFVLGVRSLRGRPPDMLLPFLPDPIDPADILDALTAVLRTQKGLRSEAIAWVKTPGTIGRPEHPWQFEVVTLLEGLPLHCGTSKIKQAPHLVVVVARLMASGRQVILESLQGPAFGGQRHGQAVRPAFGSQQAGQAVSHIQTIVDFIEGVVWTAQAKHVLRTVLV